MHNISLALGGAWKVLLIGLLLGAGLPALFAVGLRAMSWGTADGVVTADGAAAARPHPLGRLVAIVCFGVIVVVALTGVAYIVASGFGKTISFEHIFPTFVNK